MVWCEKQARLHSLSTHSTHLGHKMWIKLKRHAQVQLVNLKMERKKNSSNIKNLVKCISLHFFCAANYFFLYFVAFECFCSCCCWNSRAGHPWRALITSIVLMQTPLKLKNIKVYIYHFHLAPYSYFHSRTDMTVYAFKKREKRRNCSSCDSWDTAVGVANRNSSSNSRGSK